MRQATNDIELIAFEDNKPCGISLGFDFCGEHETSNDNLSQALELRHAGTSGLAQYLAKKISADDPRLTFYERNKPTKTIAAETRMTFHVFPQTAQKLAEPKCKLMALPAVSVRDGVCSYTLATSWSNSGFCIRAFGDTEREMVRKLYDAALQGELLVSRAGNSNPFSRSGLCLTILSMIPQSVHDAVAEKEANEKRIKKAVAETGIEQTLKDAGLSWFALSPEWSSFFKEIGRNDEKTGERIRVHPETNHPVMFFLNPRKQNIYNSGWFTVEELEAWARNEGPVIKSSA